MAACGGVIAIDPHPEERLKSASRRMRPHGSRRRFAPPHHEDQRIRHSRKNLNDGREGTYPRSRLRIYVRRRPVRLEASSRDVCDGGAGCGACARDSYPAPRRFGSFFRTDKCRDGAPEGERVDRKTRERLRTVFRRVDRKIRQGRFASARRFSALHSLIGGKEKGRATRGRHKNTGSEAMCARKASRYLKYFSIIFR
jgi:hypothetical protein